MSPSQPSPRRPPQDEARYVLTLTATQAGVLQQACELMARLAMGQARSIEMHLPDPEDPAYEAELRDTLDAIERRHHLGIRAVPLPGRLAWDLYQVIRHRLAWDRAVAEGLVPSLDAPRNWAEMMAVYYDEPLAAAPEHPLATMGSHAS